MLKRSGIVNRVIMLGVVNLAATIYASEDFSVDTDVKSANEIFKKELQKLSKKLLERGNVVKTEEEGLVEDSTILRHLMHIQYKFNMMDQEKKQYKSNFHTYYWDLDKLILKEGFVEHDDELNNLDKFFLKEPDFLLSQGLIPIKNSVGQDFSLSRRFLQKIRESRLIKKALLEEDMRYRKKGPQERLEEIKKILAQYQNCFEDPQNELMKKAKKWGPKTRDESLLAREIIYSLFEMVRTDNKDLKCPFKSARKYGKSRFNFVIKDTIALPAQ